MKKQKVTKQIGTRLKLSEAAAKRYDEQTNRGSTSEGDTTRKVDVNY